MSSCLPRPAVASAVVSGRVFPGAASAPVRTTPPRPAPLAPPVPTRTRGRRTGWVALLALLAAAAVALAVPAPAAAQEWQPVGPEGGEVAALARAGLVPEEVFAATRHGGLFRSTDGGRSWRSLLPELPVPTAWAVAVGPQGEGVVASDGETAVWSSDDGGASWQRAALPGLPRPADPAAPLAVGHLAVAPSDPSVVYAAGRGVWRSGDGGATWAPADAGQTEADVRGLAVDPTDPDTVYAAVHPDGAFRTRDGGETWQQVFQLDQPGVHSVLDVAVDPFDPDLVHLATGDGLWVSRDGGESWEQADPVPVYRVVPDPAEPGTVLTLSRDRGGLGIFFSSLWRIGGLDGETPTRVQVEVFDRLVPDVLPAAGDDPALAALERGGVWRSTGGGPWQPANRGLRAVEVNAFALVPDRPSTVDAAVRGVSLWQRSSDGGAHWRPPQPAGGVHSGPIQQLVEPPGIAPDPYLRWSFGIDQAGFDRGVAHNLFPGADHTDLAVDRLRPRLLYAITRGGVASPCLTVDCWLLHASRDGGVADWAPLPVPGGTARPLFDVAPDPVRPRLVYVAAGRPGQDGGAILRSGDAGLTWTVTGTGLPAPLVRLAVQPAADGGASRLSGFTAAGTVWTSPDAGDSWQRLDDGLPLQAVVTALDAVERPDGDLVVGTAAHGVFRRLPDGPFVPVGEGLPALPVEEVAAVPSTPVVFARLAGDGLWRVGVPVDCGEDVDTLLCLRGGRFRAEVDWRTKPRNGEPGDAGEGRVGGLDPALSADAWGWTWFFRPDNAELAVKLLDGRPVNGHWWVFYASMTDVAFDLWVTDTAQGAFQLYANPPGRLASAGDTAAFPAGTGAATAGTGEAAAGLGTGPGNDVAAAPIPHGAAGGGSGGDRAAGAVVSSSSSGSSAGSGSSAAGCGGGPAALCLQGGRFRVEVEWEDFQGGAGTGVGERLGDDSGYLWFFRRSNPELFVKVLDGRPVNGHWWVFYGSLSNVGYRLTVTDLEAGASRVWENDSGTFESAADTTAF